MNIHIYVFMVLCIYVNMVIHKKQKVFENVKSVI